MTPPETKPSFLGPVTADRVIAGLLVVSLYFAGNGRLNAQDARMDRMKHRLNQQERQLDKQDARIADQNGQLRAMRVSQDEMLNKFGDLFRKEPRE